MLRDNLAGLIEPMRAARELNPLALFTEQKKSSDDRPQDALKIPAPKGRNLTLTENAASPFHAEPTQTRLARSHDERITMLLILFVAFLKVRLRSQRGPLSGFLNQVSPPEAVYPMHPNARRWRNNPQVSDALMRVSGSVRNTATLLEVLVTMKMAPIAGSDPASA